MICPSSADPLSHILSEFSVGHVDPVSIPRPSQALNLVEGAGGRIMQVPARQTCEMGIVARVGKLFGRTGRGEIEPQPMLIRLSLGHF